jgi:hypothetical protein
MRLFFSFGAVHDKVAAYFLRGPRYFLFPVQNKFLSIPHGPTWHARKHQYNETCSKVKPWAMPCYEHMSIRKYNVTFIQLIQWHLRMRECHEE